MSRWLAGCFGAGDRLGEAALLGALAPNAASTFADASLQLAFTGPAAPTRPLCLLDGFLDNATELRDELGALPDLGGAGSAEERLLAAAYRRWGGGLPARLRGDFVLLVWDGERGEGLLARDQLGVRPLFLHESGGALRFAGELRQLLALLPRRPAPDAAGVAHWISVSTRPGLDTLYAGVRRLGPGEMLRFDRDGVSAERYWAPRFRGAPPVGAAELAADVRAELERAVGRRHNGGGMTGVLMSGGLDSSAVAAVCADSGAGPTRAYSAVFPDHPLTDETPLIEELATALDLPGVVAEVRPGGLVAAAVEHLAEWQVPLLGWGDFWALPLLRTAATEGVGTMLDGDGGDELFGPRGYLIADRLRGGRPLRALALARQLPGAGPHVPRREVASVVGSLALGAVPYRLHSAFRGPLGRRQAPPWLLPATARQLVASDDPHAWKRLDGPRWWANAAYGIAYGIEQAGVFEHQRRRAAMAGLEARHPIFDLDLVELALAQPAEASLDRRHSRPVLRAAVEGLVPDSVRLRPGKARFESLIVSCLTGPDAVAVRAILADPAAELGAYLDMGRMRSQLLDSDVLLREQPFSWMWQVWRLLTAELWLRAQHGSLPDLASGLLLSKPSITARNGAPSSLFPPCQGARLP